MLTYDEIFETIERASLNEDMNILFELDDDTFICLSDNGVVGCYEELDLNGYPKDNPIFEFGTIDFQSDENNIDAIASEIEQYLSEQGISAIIVESNMSKFDKAYNKIINEFKH